MAAFSLTLKLLSIHRASFFLDNFQALATLSFCEICGTNQEPNL